MWGYLKDVAAPKNRCMEIVTWIESPGFWYEVKETLYRSLVFCIRFVSLKRHFRDFFFLFVWKLITAVPNTSTLLRMKFLFIMIKTRFESSFSQKILNDSSSDNSIATCNYSLKLFSYQIILEHPTGCISNSLKILSNWLSNKLSNLKILTTKLRKYLCYFWNCANIPSNFSFFFHPLILLIFFLFCPIFEKVQNQFIVFKSHLKLNYQINPFNNIK